jgi:hypothetical protein
MGVNIGINREDSERDDWGGLFTYLRFSQGF